MEAGSPATTAGSVPTTTAAAPSREKVWRTTPGTAARECVDVDRLRAGAAAGRGGGPARVDDVLFVRSGEFVAGSLAERLFTDETPGAPGFDAKVSWSPLDPNVAKTEALDVVIEHLGDPSREPLRLHLDEDHHHAFAGDRYFWPSSVPLPARGRWRLTATAPGHWGCFELSL